MYNPAPRTDQNNVEFLEIYNTNPWFEDISGYQVVSDNISYTFPPGTTLEWRGLSGRRRFASEHPGRIRGHQRRRPLHRESQENGHPPAIGQPGGGLANHPLLQRGPGRWRPMAPATRSSWPTPPTAKPSRRPGTSATWSAAPPARPRPTGPAPCATFSSTKCWPTPKTPPCPASSNSTTTATKPMTSPAASSPTTSPPISSSSPRAP